jgi:hypothetical protein
MNVLYIEFEIKLICSVACLPQKFNILNIKYPIFIFLTKIHLNV